MKKIILTFICILLLTTQSYASPAMEPLSNVADRVFTKNPKDLEVAYFTGRCGALYYLFAQFFKLNGSANDAQFIEQLRQLGQQYVSVTISLSKKYGSSEFLAGEQIKGFLSTYGSQINTEKKSYDKAMIDDLKICDSYSAQFSRLADTIDKQ